MTGTPCREKITIKTFERGEQRSNFPVTETIINYYTHFVLNTSNIYTSGRHSDTSDPSPSIRCMGCYNRVANFSNI